jgi:phage tail sheath protein FI
VYQFYLNGGAEAEIVRIVARQSNATPPPPGTPNPPTFPAIATITLKGKANTDADPVVLAASSPGAWGDKLRVRVDFQTTEVQADITHRKTYNLTVHDADTGVTESYLNVGIEQDDPRSLPHVLASSSLVTVQSGAGNLPHNHADVPFGENPFADGKDADGWYTSGTGGVDGTAAPVAADYLGVGVQPDNGKQGIYQLLNADIFNILCLPGPAGQQTGPASVLTQAAKLCLDRRAMLIVDPPAGWTRVSAAADAGSPGGSLPLAGENSAKNAVVYFPRINLPDPKRENAIRDFPPCGAVAGVWARTDVQRGVWKAPAGTDAGLSGVIEPAIPMTDLENGRLNPLGINCLRQRPVVGNVVWGARTLRGADLLADQWKYVPVRRLALFIEESLFRGTQWVVFEPNDEPLWSSIRLNVGAFMNTLFRQGAFQGRTPQEAYKVTCDQTNNPQNDIDRGIVNIQVGFAPLKPAEFVIIHIQQLAGQIQV